MKCPKCKAEINHLNCWETKGVEFDLDSMSLGDVIDTLEHSIDCPKCGDPLNGYPEIADIEKKIYG